MPQGNQLSGGIIIGDMYGGAVWPLCTCYSLGRVLVLQCNQDVPGNGVPSPLPPPSLKKRRFQKHIAVNSVGVWSKLHLWHITGYI